VNPSSAADKTTRDVINTTDYKAVSMAPVGKPVNFLGIRGLAKWSTRLVQ